MLTLTLSLVALFWGALLVSAVKLRHARGRVRALEAARATLIEKAFVAGVRIDDEAAVPPAFFLIEKQRIDHKLEKERLVESLATIADAVEPPNAGGGFEDGFRAAKVTIAGRIREFKA